jgi:hypothetical protein
MCWQEPINKEFERRQHIEMYLLALKQQDEGKI